MRKNNKNKRRIKANNVKSSAIKAAEKQPVSPSETDSSTFQNADVNSKRIFENPILCAQFLRDFSGLPQFQNVQPEDIETVSLRYHTFDEVELNSDTVVRIRQNPGTNELPIYIVPLIDHKSSVDHNVSMQLLTYMVCIWKDWEKEIKSKYGWNCHNKDFRYPFIFPLVYYEGKGAWTADLNLKSRVTDMGEALDKYIPDFAYRVIRVRDYTNQALLEQGDGMSLLMILNKVQEAADFRELHDIDPDKVDSILADTPQSAVDVIARITASLCRRLNVPEEESDTYISKIRSEKKMGYLFENMEKMDIQWERKQTAEARKELQDALEQLKASKAETDAAKAEADAAKAMKQQMTADYIELLQKFLPDRKSAIQHIMEKYTLEEADAEKLLELYWK